MTWNRVVEGGIAAVFPRKCMNYYFCEYPLKSFLVFSILEFFSPKVRLLLPLSRSCNWYHTDTETWVKLSPIGLIFPVKQWRWFNRNRSLFWLCFQSGHFSEDMIPTVGFNMRKVTKGNVTIKVLFLLKRIQNVALRRAVKQVFKKSFCCFFKLQIWDIGGQPRFRSMWERYCRGVNAIVWAFHFHSNQLHMKCTHVVAHGSGSFQVYGGCSRSRESGGVSKWAA